MPVSPSTAALKQCPSHHFLSPAHARSDHQTSPTNTRIMSTDILHVWHTAETCCVEHFPALLFPGTVVTTGQAQECELTFYMTGTQQNRVVFTGLTAEEGARSDNTTTGHRLTCACPTIEGLTPLQWLDESGMVLPNNRARWLVDYKEAGNQPGSAVHFRINQDGFSCAEAGVYTCVIGTNTRTVLVTPIGEWASSCVCRRGFVQESLLLNCAGVCMCPTSAGQNCSLLPSTLTQFPSSSVPQATNSEG